MKEIPASTTTHSFQETEELGRNLAKFLLTGSPQEKATVIILKGDLGAGKTVFTRGFLSAFGIKRVLSPTFTLAKRYAVKLPSGERANVYHLDAYRLKKEHADQVGLSDMRKEVGSFVLIEWPDNIGVVPYNALIAIRHGKNETERKISITLR
jgi:tRNA threonylcarbamoyladenosine biosynthesis protein TsaE